MDSNSRQQNNTTYRDQSFLAKVEDFLNFTIENDDFKAAFSLSRTIRDFFTRERIALEQNPQIYDFYKQILIKAEFVALPLLDDGEVISLLKNNFSKQFEIAFYDLASKFKNKLINTIVYEDRDALRQEVKKNLLASGEILTGGATPPRTIGEWLKDYNVKSGTGRIDSLKRSQYFITLGKEKKLSESDKGKLKSLIDLYEETKVSTFEPDGYDHDMPIVFDDQLYNYKRGLLEKIEVDEKEFSRINNLLKNGGEEEPSETVVPPAPIKRNPAAEAEAAEIEKELTHLKELLATYPARSLERKAIEGEINKLSKK